MSLRIAPASHKPSATPSSYGAPSAPGVHDTLRSNLSLSQPSTDSQQQPEIKSTHPLEARLAKWRATQDSMKMEGLRRAYGMGEPIRRGMELRLAAQGEWRPAALGGASGVHGDVLSGRDCEVAWEDVYKGDELRDQPDFHSEMESRLKMNW